MAADDSREFGKYYEDQFGDRIRGISKDGAAPKPPNPPADPGSGSGTGRGGLGFIVLFVIIGLFRALGSFGGRHSEPPMPRIHVPEFNKPGDLDELNRLLANMRKRNEELKDLPATRALFGEKIALKLKNLGVERQSEEADDLPDPRPDR